MRRGPIGKLSCVPFNMQFKKSASMETRTNQEFAKDSIKFVPSKQIVENNALRIPRISRSRISLSDQSYVGTSEQNVSLNQEKYSKLIRPKNLPSRLGNDIKTNSIVKAFKLHLEPRATQTVSPPDRIRQLNSPTVTFTMTGKMHTSKKENIKKIKPIMNIFLKDDTM